MGEGVGDGPPAQETSKTSVSGTRRRTDARYSKPALPGRAYSAVVSLLAGHYELLGEVGAGPVSVLHRARVRGAGGFTRLVAVREVDDDLASDRHFVAAWARAAAALSDAASPHVEQVLDVVADRSGASFVSEWVEGISLASLIDAHLERAADVPWPVAVEIAIQILRGLGAAHSLGLRHDALSAEAVRIARDGTAKLTRFGMAAALSETGVGRREMETRGLRHPAPELIDGHDPDAATDQYGAGALLFTLLAGEPPFDEPPGADRDLTVMTELPDLAVRRPDVPPLLIATAERALRVSPEDRFESVAQMERTLRQLLRSHPGPTGPSLLAEVVASVAPPLPLAEPALAEPALAEPAEENEPVRRPLGLSDASTMHVNLDELTELAPPPLEEPLEAPPLSSSVSASRARPYQFDFKRRTASQGDPESHSDGEAEPLPLTTRSDASLTLEDDVEIEEEAEPLTLDVTDRPDTRPPSARPSVRVPMGLVNAKTEFLDDGQLDELRIDEDE